MYDMNRMVSDCNWHLSGFMQRGRGGGGHYMKPIIDNSVARGGVSLYFYDHATDVKQIDAWTWTHKMNTQNVNCVRKTLQKATHHNITWGNVWCVNHMAKSEWLCPAKGGHPGIWILWNCVMKKNIWKSKDPDISVSLISNGPPHVDWL